MLLLLISLHGLSVVEHHTLFLSFFLGNRRRHLQLLRWSLVLLGNKALFQSVLLMELRSRKDHLWLSVSWHLWVTRRKGMQSGKHGWELVRFLLNSGLMRLFRYICFSSYSLRFALIIGSLPGGPFLYLQVHHWKKLKLKRVWLHVLLLVEGLDSV